MDPNHIKCTDPLNHEIHAIVEENEINSPTQSSNGSENSNSRSDMVDTYVISIKKGIKLNTKSLKNASMKKIDINDDFDKIGQHLQEVEKATIEIVNNYKSMSLSFTNCCMSLDCLSKNDAELKLYNYFNEPYYNN
jgi:hypothetical protein